jgi:hypothetical protein
MASDLAARLGEHARGAVTRRFELFAGATP